jgi:hypothetical protein
VSEGASHCASCGAVVDQVGEFHPHVFCVIKRAYPSRVPWDVFRETAAKVGAALPQKPPLVRDLPAFQHTEVRDSAPVVKVLDDPA